jgi:membrane protease YdiL (CAAX protease family)
MPDNIDLPNLDRSNPPPHFLDMVRYGRCQGWCYGLSVFMIGFYWWEVAGYVAWSWQSLIIQLLPWQDLGQDLGLIAAIFMPHIGLLLLLWWVVRGVHDRSLITLITSRGAIDWRRLGAGFGVWLGLLIAFNGSEQWLLGGAYQWSFTPVRWLTLLPFLLVLIPIQTSVEELLYRGYLMQGLGLVSKNPLVLSLATGIAFMIPHLGNPEMARGFMWTALTYLTWGIFFALITLKDNGLELALGCHAANNLFTALVVNTPDSAIATPALWTYTLPIRAEEGFVALVIFTTFFYAIFLVAFLAIRSPYDRVAGLLGSGNLAPTRVREPGPYHLA